MTSYKLKLENDLIEARLQQLKLAMQKEKEERRRLAGNRWKSIRAMTGLTKSETILPSRTKAPGIKFDDLLTSEPVKNIRFMTPKDLTMPLKRGEPRKTSVAVDASRVKLKSQEKNNKATKAPVMGSQLELKCIGSALHCRSPLRTHRSENHNAIRLSKHDETRIENSVNDSFNEDTVVSVPCAGGDLLVGKFDETNSSQLFQAAVNSWRNSRNNFCRTDDQVIDQIQDQIVDQIEASVPVVKSIPVECSDQGTNPEAKVLQPVSIQFTSSTSLQYHEQLLLQNLNSLIWNHTSCVENDGDRNETGYVKRNEDANKEIDDINVNIEDARNENDDFKENVVGNQSVKFERLRMISIKTAKKKTMTQVLKSSTDVQHEKQVCFKSEPRARLEIEELDNFEFDASVLEDGPQWELAELTALDDDIDSSAVTFEDPRRNVIDPKANTVHYEPRENDTRSTEQRSVEMSRSYLTITQMFDDRSKSQLSVTESNEFRSPSPRWSFSKPSKDFGPPPAPLLGLPSIRGDLDLRTPSPRPLANKYRHVQSKVAQMWLSPQSPEAQQPLLRKPTIVIEENSIPVYKRQTRKKRANKRSFSDEAVMVKDRNLLGDRVGEDVIVRVMDLHMSRLGGISPLMPTPTEEFKMDFVCKDFGMKDFLNIDLQSIENEFTSSTTLGSQFFDIGKALDAKPPEILDDHLVVMAGGRTPPLIDRTPTPPPDADIDGFDCVNESSEQTELPDDMKNEAIVADNAVESDVSESEQSLGMLNSSVDSFPESESETITVENLGRELDSLNIDRAVDSLLMALSTNELEGLDQQQIDTLLEIEDDPGDGSGLSSPISNYRFDDLAIVNCLE